MAQMKVSFNMKWLDFRVNITPKGMGTGLPESGQLANAEQMSGS